MNNDNSSKETMGYKEIEIKFYIFCAIVKMCRRLDVFKSVIKGKSI